MVKKNSKFRKLTKEEKAKIDMMMKKHPNQLENWYQAVLSADVLSPKTIIKEVTKKDWCSFLREGDQSILDIYIEEFDTLIKKEIGYPCFVRTSITSNKHRWKDSCYVESSETLRHCMMEIVGYAVFAPIRFTSFVARKLIKTKPFFYAFNGMPVTKERRYFINDGKVVCHHPYWTKEAIKNHTNDNNWESLLEEMNIESDLEVNLLTEMAEKIGRYLNGWWSIDFLQDEEGNWFCIDLAIGVDSYHYPNCNYTFFSN